jgi:hypothetical protein
MEPTFSFAKKLATCCVAGLTCAAFWLLLGNGGGVPWMPAAVVFPLVAFSLVGSMVLLVWWQLRGSKYPAVSRRIGDSLILLIRYLTAFNIASFGWKKLFGLQFVVPAAIASQPMNQQSGEWLTWYYFGFSPAFGLLIAAIQIVGAGLLLFRRTLLLGAVILAALFLNLTLINIFYHLNAGALVQSVVDSLAILFILGLHYRQLVAMLLPSSGPEAPPALGALTRNLGRISAILLSLLFAAYLKVLLH